MNDKEILWKRYELLVQRELKFLDLLVRFTIFYFGITGAIISFVIVNKTHTPQLDIAYVVPSLMGIVFGVYFLAEANNQKVPTEELERIADKLFRLTLSEQESIRAIEQTDTTYQKLNTEEKIRHLKTTYGIDQEYMFANYDALKHSLIFIGVVFLLVGLFLASLLYYSHPITFT